MKLAIRECADLEGTSKVIIEADERTLSAPVSAGDNGHLLARLRNGRIECGALVDKMRPGANTLLVDKYLRIYLKARTNEEIEIELTKLQPAVSATLRVPSTWLAEGATGFLNTRLRGRPIWPGGKIPIHTFVGTVKVVEVTKTRPAGVVLVDKSTELVLERQEEAVQKGANGVTYHDIGGLDGEIRRIRELIEYPLRSPDLFAHLGIEPSRGVILYGPPGTGKTLIAKALSNEVGAHFLSIQGPELISSLVGESEQKLRDIFKQAQTNTPAVILIDELDSLAPKRDHTRGELESRMVATLLTLMDGLKARGDGTVVLGTTNRLDAIDPALRRPGRFDHEIHIGVPGVAGRKRILELHTAKTPLAESVDIQVLAEKTVGFTGADIAYLCREACFCALRGRYPSDILDKGDIFVDQSLVVEGEDFQTALKNIQPSALREITVQVPKDISWADIGGLDDIRRLITENVVYGIKKAEAFRSVGIRPARGLLLYGPPGTGKTLLAKAVANECGANFITVRGPELRSKWFGESEEKIRFIFAKAREVSPCVLFFDEIDALAPRRGRDATALTDSLVNQLLSEMDGIEVAADIFVIAATNMPKLVDPALLRPGRFDYQIEVPLPDEEARLSILKVHLSKSPLSDDVEPAKLAEVSEGLSGADIGEACRRAAFSALRRIKFSENGAVVTAKDYEEAVEAVRETQAKLKTKIGFQPPSDQED